MARTTKSTATTPAAATTAKITDTLTIDAADIDATVEAYVAASTGDKTKIRNAVTKGMTDAVKAMDLTTAQLWSALGDAVASAVTKPATEVDYNRVIADRIIALHHAAHLMTMGDVTPEGIDTDKIDLARVTAYLDEWQLAGDKDAVTNEIHDAAKRIAGAKITRTTVRGSIEAHIETAFADLTEGTFLTVAQIRTRSGAASDGAISARLRPRGGKPVTLDLVALGVEITEVNGVLGLRKVTA